MTISKAYDAKKKSRESVPETNAAKGLLALVYGLLMAAAILGLLIAANIEIWGDWIF